MLKVLHRFLNFTITQSQDRLKMILLWLFFFILLFTGYCSKNSYLNITDKINQNYYIANKKFKEIFKKSNFFKKNRNKK